VTVVSPGQLVADLRGLAPAVRQAVHVVVVKRTAALQRQVVANASGNPVDVGPHGFGPNAVTGDYRRSINRLTVQIGDESIGMVGTNKPQGRRLEFGFVGEDSLGRSYDQPAYPHFGPALDDEAPRFEQAVKDAISEAQS
jgi:hypothetical protein